MAFDDVENLVESVSSFGQDSKVMMVGEVSALALELVKPFVEVDSADPHAFDLHFLKLFSPVVMVMLDLFNVDVPVSPDFFVRLDLYKLHQILLIIKSMNHS